ncbi:hypothetical protein D3C72_1587370 [compost metagenome]
MGGEVLAGRRLEGQELLLLLPRGERHGAIGLGRGVELLPGRLVGLVVQRDFLLIFPRRYHHVQLGPPRIQQGDLHLVGGLHARDQVAGDLGAVTIQTRQLGHGEPGKGDDQDTQDGESTAQFLANRHVFEHGEDPCRQETHSGHWCPT